MTEHTVEGRRIIAKLTSGSRYYPQMPDYDRQTEIMADILDELKNLVDVLQLGLKEQQPPRSMGGSGSAERAKPANTGGGISVDLAGRGNSDTS